MYKSSALTLEYFVFFVKLGQVKFSLNSTPRQKSKKFTVNHLIIKEINDKLTVHMPNERKICNLMIKMNI